MSDLAALIRSIDQLESANDLDGLRQVREQIVEHHGDSEEAAEAQYKLGLDTLFRRRDVAGALTLFEAAAKRKHPFWSAAARTSMGLCYYHQGRAQKALFELRRVAHPDQPNAHSITALSFMENIFATEGNLEEEKRARATRIEQLERLITANRDTQGDPSERGYFLFQLGIALADVGDAEAAGEALREAKQLGPEKLGAELYRSVVDALG